MIKQMPEISIIIPVYKAEKYLVECIDSVLAQIYSDFECILVEDGSPDSSGKICDEYAAKDSRIKVIHQNNSGVAKARNVGLDNASGSWIMFIDSDDWIEPNLLELAIRATKEHNVDIVQWNYIPFGEQRHIQKYQPLKEGWFDFSKEKPLPWWMGMCWSRLYSADLIRGNSLRFPESIRLCEDTLFSYSAIAYAKKIWCIEKKLYHYRCRDDSALHTSGRAQMEDKIKVLKSMEQVFDSLGLAEKFESSLYGFKMEIKNWFIHEVPPDFNEYRNQSRELNFKAIWKTHGKAKLLYLLIALHLDCLAYGLMKLYGKIMRKNIFHSRVCQ